MNAHQDASQQRHQGFAYLLQGLQLISQPGLRLFVVVPLVINVLLFGLSFFWLYQQLGGWIDQALGMLPTWLQWLNMILWPLAIISVLLVYGFSFSMLANIIAAPFNGLLAEKTEQFLVSGDADSTGIWDMLKDVPRILMRELQKIGYWLPRAIGIFLVFLIPGVGQVVAAPLWFIFGAWMMTIQYGDYPFDNHRVPFKTMRQQLAQHRLQNLSFGALVSICASLPIINLIIMPVSVCGATAMWVDHYRHQNH
ncbi:sulfate transporter CysZ [Alginatibacterium sediminis]|uniref:Sulfate transporter CysZ n=1 Tax=Alginatibacterium sediminis TaxID=2164068 RepID=A0A420EBK0_9ALTE|nr:sulfate transporter CysZ [Alginatibacterium sediminis]RKF18069.1 sulfate transporter CysZ [Alginatibacterium sediminis]